MKSVKTVFKVTAAAAVALAVVSGNDALASKARVSSLQGALGLVDTQTVFQQPAYMHKLGQYATYEFGATPEGGFALNGESAKWGVYLGHKNEMIKAARGTTYLAQENPVDVFYGQDNWALNVSLSNSSAKTPADQSQTTLTAGFGMVNDDSEWNVNLVALGNAENKAPKTKQSGGPAVSAGYLMKDGDSSYAINVSYAMATFDPDTKTNITDMAAELAFNRRPVPEFYYGAALSYHNMDQDTAGKKNTLSLPIFVGFEKDVFSWMTARASISQGFLIGSEKAEQPKGTVTSEKANANDTKVAAGLGFKANGFTLDGTLAAATNGAVNGTQFLANAALTYAF